MPIIDAQVHAYERNHPGRPWHAVLAGPPEVTGEQMVAAMDENGVDGAILISAFTMYRYDSSYAVAVRNRYPHRFALIKPVDPANPAVAEVIADWKRMPGAVAVRLLLVRGGYNEDPADPGLNRVLKEAARLSVPVNLHIAGRLDQGIELIRRTFLPSWNPDTRPCWPLLCWACSDRATCHSTCAAGSPPTCSPRSTTRRSAKGWRSQGSLPRQWALTRSPPRSRSNTRKSPISRRCWASRGSNKYHAKT